MKSLLAHKKNALTIGFCALVGAAVFFFLPTPASAACQAPTFEYPAGSGTCVDPRGCKGSMVSSPGGKCDVDTRKGIGAISNNGTAVAEKLSCDSFIGGGGKCFIARLFYDIVYLTFGTLLTVAAAFLDVVIEVTILKFADWITVVTGVRVAWIILRDVMNITFIFMLLYASISMILGNGKEKGIIKGVIVAGLLINFSYFFTSVIIDASNVLTVTQFETIQLIGKKYTGTTTDPTKPGVFSTANGITNVFMQGLGVQTQSPAGLSPNGEDVESHIFQQLVFSSIAILVIAFVFFAMAFLLLGRFIVLIILLITSPVSVMGGVLPQLAEHSKKWWKTLIDQAVFAPIMMLFMLVTVLIVSNPSFKAGLNVSTQEGMVPFAGGIAGMINYAIVIGLLVTGMVVAKKSAGAASNGLSDWAMKKAQSIPSTAGKWAGQKVTGAAGAATGGLGRLGVKHIVNPLSNKYDLAMGKLAQSDNKAAKFVSGAARNLGIDEGVRDTFKGVAAAKFGGQVNLAEREKQLAQRTKEVGQAVREDEAERKIRAGMELSEELRKRNAYNTGHVAKDAAGNEIKDAAGNAIKPIEDFIKEVGKLTNNQIEEMLQKGDKKLTDQTFASALTAKHMEKILESALISDKAKGDIIAARENGMLARLDATKVADAAAEAARFASGKPADVAQLPAKILTDTEVSSRLSVGALSKIATDGKVSEDDKEKIKKNIESRLSELDGFMGPLSPNQETNKKSAEKLDKWLKSTNGEIF